MSCFLTSIRCAIVVSALIATASPTAAQPLTSESRAKRRTPAVEVFENWKDSVVFVVGPMASKEQKALDEFFQLGGTPSKEQNLGTGFILHESGYVVTNAHGVERQITHHVVLSDGKAYPAELLAVLHSVDMALLKIEVGRPLKAVRLGLPGDVMIGETVIVIANPHGLMRTCTVGVVSAIGRSTNLLDVPGVRLEDLIQSDAGVNPGSSGGPWFNIAGEVVGMTASMRRDSENIAFAVSSGSLHRAFPQLLDAERRFGLFTGMSVVMDGACRVIEVKPDTPAARTGIRPGDLIKSLDGRPISTGGDWQLSLIGRKPGQPMTLEVVRDGKAQPTVLVPSPRPRVDPATVLRTRLGIVAAALDAAKAKAFGLRVPRGIVVNEVNATFYQKYQHKPEVGDVLACIDGLRPRDLDQAAYLIDKVPPGQTAKLVFLRRRGETATRTDVLMTMSP